MYGWDSRIETWYGPNELDAASPPDRRLLRSLREAPGHSWYGRLHCSASNEPQERLFVLVHELSDCGVASIYCDESKAGPAEIVAVLPPARRAQLREGFAFEFLAFAGFLGSVSPGAALRVHDEIEAALAAGSDSATLVFSISSGLWPNDLDPVLSRCVEKVATTLRHWLEPVGAGAVPVALQASERGTAEVSGYTGLR